MKVIRFVFLSCFFLFGCSIEVPENIKTGVSEEELRDLAQQLARDLIIIDTHIDTPYRIEEGNGNIDLSVRSDMGDFDFVRAKEGGLNAAFMSVYIPASFQAAGGARKKADDLIDLVEGFATTWPQNCAIARSADDVRDQFSKGMISFPLGMENGAGIGDDLTNLQYFYDRGIRYITLTHSKANQICDSSYDENRTWNGLSPFGKNVVAEMNRLGIMVDVSHVTDDSFYQVLEISKVPVIASHSSCRYFTPGWERNMSDDMIKILAENGGVIQINFGSMFLDNDYLKNQTKIFEKVTAFLRENNLKPEDPEAEKYLDELKQEFPVPEVNENNVVQHINHVVEIAGIDHVGLGSDYDGVGDSVPVNLEDVSTYPNLILALLKEGYSADDIEKICGENLLRVWKAVEDYSLSLGN